MEKQLDFVPKLSLKEMALRKVVVCFWNENDVLIFMEKARLSNFESFKETEYLLETSENQIKNKISKLVVPISVKKQMISLVRPIGLDMIRWKKFHEDHLGYPNFGIHILKQLHWTCIGAIDYQKTAEKLIHLEMLTVVIRYKLACFYCLVDYIPLLWKELDEESQLKFSNDISANFTDNRLEYIWPFILKGEESALEIIWRNSSRSFNQYMVQSSALVGNKAAVKYFFRLLTEEEAEHCLRIAVCAVVDFKKFMPWLFVTFISYERRADCLCYLLSMMRPEEQTQVLRKQPCHILHYLFNWPWYDLFVDITNFLWTFIPEDKYIELFFIVINPGFYCPNLFQKLFLNGPSELRRHFVVYESQHSSSPQPNLDYFADFFSAKDIKSIKVVFRNLNASDRVELVSCLKFFEMFNRMRNDRWHLVELCFREAIQSKEDKEKLKNRFIEVFESTNASEELLSKKREWEEYIELLAVTDATSNKRSLEDAAENATKKIFL